MSAGFGLHVGTSAKPWEYGRVVDVWTGQGLHGLPLVGEFFIDHDAVRITFPETSGGAVARDDSSIRAIYFWGLIRRRAKPGDEIEHQVNRIGTMIGRSTGHGSIPDLWRRSDRRGARSEKSNGQGGRGQARTDCGLSSIGCAPKPRHSPNHARACEVCEARDPEDCGARCAGPRRQAASSFAPHRGVTPRQVVAHLACAMRRRCAGG